MATFCKFMSHSLAGLPMHSAKSAKMSKPKLLITRRIEKEAFEILSSKYTIDIWDDEDDIPPEELLKRIPGVDALFCFILDKIDKKVLDAAGPSLKIVSTMSVGVDHIDTAECAKRGIVVGHTPKVSTNSIAEFTVGLLLAASRRMLEGANKAKSGEWSHWHAERLEGPCLESSTVGIVGLGRIGLAILERLWAFKPAKVVYYDMRRRSECEEKKLGVEFVSFEDLLGQSDFVITMCALTPESKHLFNARTFGMMKNSAVFINTSRGGVVDQDALYHALKNGTIFAAGLDVTTPEPLPHESPLYTLDNCVITPHIASASLAARKAMAVLASNNIICCLEGKTMPARFVE